MIGQEGTFIPPQHEGIFIVFSDLGKAWMVMTRFLILNLQ